MVLESLHNQAVYNIMIAARSITACWFLLVVLSCGLPEDAERVNEHMRLPLRRPENLYLHVLCDACFASVT